MVVELLLPYVFNHIHFKIIHVLTLRTSYIQFHNKNARNCILAYLHFLTSFWIYLFFNREWVERAPAENIVRVLICLRLLLRDTAFQKLLFELGGVKVLSERLQTVTEDYLSHGEQEPFMVDILKEMSSKFLPRPEVSSGRSRLSTWKYEKVSRESIIWVTKPGREGALT